MIKTKIYGAPGTGKTTDLLRRLEETIASGVPLNRIAFVTHTVAARDEARSRAQKLLPHTTEKDFRYFKTIHGICYSQIMLERQNVMQDDDFIRFGNDTGIEFSTKFDITDDGVSGMYSRTLGNQVMAAYQLASAMDLEPSAKAMFEFYPEDLDPWTVASVLEKYRAWKAKHSKFDFVDMLEMYLRDKYSSLPIDVLFVDEAQDLSKKQWRIVLKMMERAMYVYLAGDDDQSIYGFIGADPTGFYDYAADETIILPKTFRLPRRIWAYANKIISGVSKRQAKEIAVANDGGIVEHWAHDPADAIVSGSKSTMVIARHYAQLDRVADALDMAGTPYSIKGKTIIGSDLARAVYWYHKGKLGDPVPIRDAALIFDAFGLKDKAKALKNEQRTAPTKTITLANDHIYTLPWMQSLSGGKEYTRRRIERLLGFARQNGLEAIITHPSIDLTTYHGSKGREADHIVLLTDCFRAAETYAEKHPDEEIRLCYVGATRAIKKLTVCSPQTNMFMKPLYYARA